MFSALKKRWTTRQDDSKASPFPSGVAAIGQAMQSKFSKGIQYNMKIVIRGERNTGKSCLLARLQGKPFTEAYIPTQEIQAASINWKHRTGDDVVKVDVWDIVDKGQKKKPMQDKLKISNDASEIDGDGVALDAAFIDVYKGTNGVIMILDITKPWTWKYIERELPKVPNHLPVLIMANFRDMGEHRSVDNDTIMAVIEHLDRPVGSAEVNFVESSLKNGFGLRYLYQFLNIPFLILQRETLLRQLEANALEIDETRELLLRDEEKDMQNYDKFIASLEMQKGKTSGSVTPSNETEESVSDTPPSSKKDMATAPVTSLPPSNLRQSTITPTSNVVNGRNYTAKVEMVETRGSVDRNETSPESSKDIHEFTPEADLDPSFLEGGEKRKKWWNRKQPKTEPQHVPEVVSEDESDDDGGNPLVMAYQDFDSDDETNAAKAEKINKMEHDDDDDSEDDVKDTDDKAIDSDESDHVNPLVTAPVDADSSDDDARNDHADYPDHVDDGGIVTTSVGNLEATTIQEGNNITQTKHHKEVLKIEAVKPIQQNEDSSDDEDENEARYEVAEDFDIDEPSFDDWLGGKKKVEDVTGKDKSGSDEESKLDDITLTQSESIKSKDGIDITTTNSSDGKEAVSNITSFMISADDLDIFVSEQMRKSSISKDIEEAEETKKPKKKKDKKVGDGERKKKKKSSSERVKNEDGEEREERKKKSKSKDGKKKKSSKRTAESTNESNSYELL